MGRGGRFLAVVWLTSCALGATLLAADAVRVTPLLRDGRVLVSCELLGGLTQEIRDAIRSGLPTTITYDIELRRAEPLWLDKVFESAAVSVTVRYDNLTRRYQVSRTMDGRMEEAQVLDSDEAVRRWMTAFERLPLFATGALEKNGEYYVRVRARTRPRTAWFSWLWGRGTASGSAKFTFIP